MLGDLQVHEVVPKLQELYAQAGSDKQKANLVTAIAETGGEDALSFLQETLETDLDAIRTDAARIMS